MLGKSSPFKKLTHSRSGSTEDHSGYHSHRRSVSASSQGPPISGHKKSASRTSNSSVSSNFLAEQYDRDRRAIISSCFGQTENSGSRPSKTYVTHVRIIEDARFPSSRPPANSPLGNKKKRVLIISSKTDGSGMQLHKARENNNGSFQIGRTWELREVLSIERDIEQPEGFLLTMGKKYYWETNSAKERIVFIKSLVKIYMENSGGHVPALVNWDLSMFYLDEKSYERALIQPTNRNNSQKPSNKMTPQMSRQRSISERKGGEHVADVVAKTTELSMPAPLATKKPVLVPPQSFPHNSNASVQKFTTQVQDKLAQQPSKQAFKHDRLPAQQTPKSAQNSSQASPVSSSLSKNHSGESQKNHPQGSVHENIAYVPPQVPSPELADKPLHSAPATNISQLSSSPRKPLSKSPYSQVKTVNQMNDSLQSLSSAKLQTSNTSSSNNVQSLPEKSDNFLAELNTVLTSPAQNVDFVSHRKSYVEVEAETESVPEALNYGEGGLDENAEDRDEEDFAELYDSGSSLEQFNSTRDETHDDGNELSFEKGDEARYSQILDSPASHAYHEVSTIREEPLTQPHYELESGREDSLEKTTGLADNQALLEILDDVNWDVDDDCDRVLEKLHSKLAETEYGFNKELLSLPEHCNDYSSYKSSVMKECDKLDPILSFFVIEMSTVSQDIEYVESQANGLQVESANKKILWKELSEILNSVSIDESSLNELLSLTLSERNLEKIERLLFALYTALKAIRGDKQEKEFNLGEMRALKERRQAYEKVTGMFLRRAVEEMDKKFKTLGHDNVTNEQLANILSRMMIYSSLVSFCKDISSESYSKIIEEWNRDIRETYEKRTKTIISTLNPRQTGLAPGVKIATQEAQLDLLLECWQSYRNSKSINPNLPSNSQYLVTVINSVLAMEGLCVTYQNFIDGFFHIGGTMDFAQYVTDFPNLNSRIRPLDVIEEMELDRESSIFKTELVTEVFHPLFAGYSNGLLQLVKQEQLLAPVLLFLIESEISKFKSSNQEFLMSTFKKIFDKINQEWREFLDDQVVYIERATIDLKSKKISPIIMGFPLFVKNLVDEISFLKGKIERSPAHFVQSQKVLNESFTEYGAGVIALLLKDYENESRAANLRSSTSPEALDECVSLLVNANWMLEMLPIFGNELFSDCLLRTKKVFDHEKERYSEILIKSAMNRLYSFVEGAYGLVEASRARPVDPSRWAAYSRQNLNKILDRYTSHEISTLIVRLYSYVERDFLGGKESIINSQLCDKLWSCIQGQTVSLYLKLLTLIDKHYKGTSVKFTKNDIITAFNEHKKV